MNASSGSGLCPSAIRRAAAPRLLAIAVDVGFSGIAWASVNGQNALHRRDLGRASAGYTVCSRVSPQGGSSYLPHGTIKRMLRDNLPRLA